jgi:hypothetical protein
MVNWEAKGERAIDPYLWVLLIMPRPSRNARIRGSAKLIALCAEYSITPDNHAAHFKISRTKKPRTMPGP